MECDEIVVKESPGLCRCCLSEGCSKELGSEYVWMNDREVYADMLLECFDISISQHNEGPNGPYRLICEVCITRLRDACNFKKQVLDSEKKFVDMIGRGEFRPKVLIYQSDLKSEQIAEEPVPDDGESEYLDEDIDFGDNVLIYQSDLKSEPIAEEQVPDDGEIEYLDEDIDFGDNAEMLGSESQQVVVEDITVSALPIKGKRCRPWKNPETKTEKPKTSIVVKGNTRGGQKTSRNRKGLVNEKSADNSGKGSESESTDHEVIETRDNTWCKTNDKLTAKEKLKIMRDNIVEVLKKSTVMPFRWLKSSYRCFYCYDIFQEATDLKSHQFNHIGDEVKEQAMKNYWEPVVYVDISDLACKLCTEQVDDLHGLIDHLVANHGVVYNKDVGICMLAFKLDNFSLNCLACGASFYTFGPLLHHTNKDHKGTSAILCDVCGQHFKDVNLLRLHVKSVHENTGLLCPECGEKFETRAKLKTHQKNMHDVNKKYKCLMCSLTFQSYYKRSRHMAAEHKNRQEVKCLHCPKTFLVRSIMMTHLRDIHLKVRNHVCGVCGWRASNSDRLKNHMYRHSGEKNFKCEACDKAFTTKKVMRAHFARMHKTPTQNSM